MMMEVVERNNERVIQELKNEIEILKSLNQNLHEENVKLNEENKTLKNTVNEYEETLKEHNDHVQSLRDLAAQDREWLDLKVSYRQSQLNQTRMKTAAAKRRASNNF